MQFHSRLVLGLIWVNVLLFALLLGGNLYEQCVIVPYWADDPPRTLQFWREIMSGGHFTFYALTPAAIITAVISAAVSWRVVRLRFLLAAAAVSIVMVLVITLVWAVPLLKALFPFEMGNEGVAADLTQIIKRFQIVGWVRWAALLAGFAALLLALSRSSAATPSQQT